jgi:hypothetical protein
MSQDALDLPEALLQAVQEVAQAEQRALDDCVLPTLAGKIAAVRTVQDFRHRAARATPQAFRAVLARIKHAAGPVVEGDELEPGRGAHSSRCHDTYKRVF